MAQIPEDVKNQILAARQSFSSTKEELEKPILQFSGAVARAGQQQSRMGSYNILQQAKATKEKTKGDVQLAELEFETTISKQAPEVGKTELVQKEYDLAIQKIQEKIK